MFLSSGEAFWGCISFGLSVIAVLFGALVMAAGAYVMYVGLTTDSPGMMVASATVLVAIPFVWKKTRS